MSCYIETFVIDGTTYGIEDYKDGRPPEDHFMADRAKKRYKCWKGGCGVGDRDTLEQARKLIYDYAQLYLSTEHCKTTLRLQSLSKTLSRLGLDDVFQLAQFVKRS